MNLRLPLFTCLVAVTTAALAQEPAPVPQVAPASQVAPAPGVPAEAKQAYIRVRDNILKAVEKMPEQDFAFKPTPEIRTFAQVVNHVTEAQTRICSSLNGQMKPAPAAATTKVDVVSGVRQSFEECDKAYDLVNVGNMAEMVAAGPVRRSKLALLFGNISHDNEMYGTLSVYMRLKGIVPPSSEAPPAPPK